MYVVFRVVTIADRVLEAVRPRAARLIGNVRIAHTDKAVCIVIRVSGYLAVLVGSASLRTVKGKTLRLGATVPEARIA